MTKVTLEGGPQLLGKEYDSSASYAKNRWKHIQYLAHVFWRRWRKEYLTGLQERTKWKYPRRSLKVGDVVLIVDNSVPRGHWPMERISWVKESDDKLVRCAKVKTQNGETLRPISKFVFCV